MVVLMRVDGRSIQDIVVIICLPFLFVVVVAKVSYKRYDSKQRWI